MAMEHGDRGIRDTDGAERRRRAVESYWRAAEDRDWAGFAALLAPDVVYRLPQTGEVVRGRETYVRFNVEYPGDWHVSVHRLVADQQQATSWTRVGVAGDVMDGVTFFGFDHHGLIDEVTDFWPEPYAAPPGREHLTVST